VKTYWANCSPKTKRPWQSH